MPTINEANVRVCDNCEIDLSKAEGWQLVCDLSNDPTHLKSWAKLGLPAHLRFCFVCADNAIRSGQYEALNDSMERMQAEVPAQAESIDNVMITKVNKVGLLAYLQDLENGLVD